MKWRKGMKNEPISFVLKKKREEKRKRKKKKKKRGGGGGREGGGRRRKKERKKEKSMCARPVECLSQNGACRRPLPHTVSVCAFI